MVGVHKVCMGSTLKNRLPGVKPANDRHDLATCLIEIFKYPQHPQYQT